MKDEHAEFIPKWTKLTLLAIKNGRRSGTQVHHFVRMKDDSLEFTSMDFCYVGEAYCFDWWGKNEDCADCDNLFAYPPNWIYKSKDSFLQWKDMFYQHMALNHEDLLK